jgi:hypothetical protein
VLRLSRCIASAGLVWGATRRGLGAAGVKRQPAKFDAIARQFEGARRRVRIGTVCGSGAALPCGAPGGGSAVEHARVARGTGLRRRRPGQVVRSISDFLLRNSRATASAISRHVLAATR